MRELNLQVGDYFNIAGETKLYRVVCFSNLKGVRIPQWIITYAEKDGCCWSRPVVQLVHAGYTTRSVPADAEDWRKLG